MCDYCRHHYWIDDNGEEHETELGESIINENFDIITKGIIDSEGIEGEFNCVRERQLLVEIMKFENKSVLCVGVYSTDNIKDDSSIHREISIKYCPMCGRKL